MSLAWRPILRHGTLPLAAVGGLATAAGLVVWVRPEDIVPVVLLITLLATGAGLVTATLFDLTTNLRGRPIGMSRAIILALPLALFVGSVIGLQSSRLLGPLTIALGTIIVVLADYVLWPRPADS